jgi:hypothetical protein
MTTPDVRAHLREMKDVEVSPDLISRVPTPWWTSWPAAEATGAP